MEQQRYLKTFLSESEIGLLQSFTANTKLREAVKKVILCSVYTDGKLEPDKDADPLQNFFLGIFTTQTAALLSTEEKGKKLDAIIQAISLIETGFSLLEKLKPIEVEEKENKNRAR